MKKLYVLFLLLSLSASQLIAQCTHQVTHSSGTTPVNGVQVTVTSAGTVDVNSGYCVTTYPYFIGYSYVSGNSGNGHYTFSFSPPIASATLNFSGTSNIGSDAEEVRLFVNGAHYAIPAKGTLTTCDALADLTANGDVAGCSGCGVSGWAGTTVPGPISTLTVDDTVLTGAPAGSIFSLFICDSVIAGVQENMLSNNYHISPNPFTDQTIIRFYSLKENSVFKLYNLSGQLIEAITDIKNSEVIVNRESLPSGLYYFVVMTDNNILVRGKIAAE